jgi:hypothetical protein
VIDSKVIERDAGGKPVATFPHPALAALLLVLATTCPSTASLAQDLDASDWPCQQVLVRRISLPAVWPGPSIDDIDWRKDPARVELIAKLAARRTPIEDAQKSIDALATTAGPRKDTELVALFAGLFETLDAERTQVVDGLIRFGRKQRELAEAIKAGQAVVRARAEPHDKAPDAEPPASRMDWDLRIFEERRQALASVCESPALIEQRLFALARTIEQALD